MFSHNVQWRLTFLVLLIVGGTHATNATSPVRSCEDARLKCAYRAGCGTALTSYLAFCAADLREDITTCPESCQHALIGLMSTDEGKELMTCECSKDDAMCKKSKQRAEVCRSSVLAEMNRTRVSCRIASAICNADVLCSTALLYYHQYCKRMFNGRKCTYRCRNSIGILTRQEKAARLNTCICDGSENYDCKGIQRNMNFLCFGKQNPDIKKMPPDTTRNKVPKTDDHVYASGNGTFIFRTELLFGLILILFMSKD